MDRQGLGGESARIDVSALPNLQSYADLVRDGRIEKFDLLIWTLLQQGGSMTARELSEASGIQGIHSRLAKLTKLGLLRHGQRRPCAYSQKMSLTWRIVTTATDEPKQEPRDFWIVCASSGFVFSSESDALDLTAALDGGAEIIHVREVIRSR